MFETRNLPPDNIDSTTSCLLKDLKEEDTNAWRELIYLYGPFVRRWAAEDGVQGEAIQEIFLEVFTTVRNNADRFQREEERVRFRSWLKSITARKVAEHQEVKSNLETISGSEATDTIIQLSAIEADAEPLSPADELALVHRAISMIQGEFRSQTWKAFERTAVDGDSTAKVAQELGINPAVVRKHKAQVLRRLRVVLKDAGLAEWR